MVCWEKNQSPSCFHHLSIETLLSDVVFNKNLMKRKLPSRAILHWLRRTVGLDHDSINWFTARTSNRCQQCDTERGFGSLFKHSDSSRYFRLWKIRNWPAKCIDGVCGLCSLPCHLPEITKDAVPWECTSFQASRTAASYTANNLFPPRNLCLKRQHLLYICLEVFREMVHHHISQVQSLFQDLSFVGRWWHDIEMIVPTETLLREGDATIKQCNVAFPC